ncbi:Oligosaccharides import ATP-binding protein MsmX [Fusobacterium necrophorum]|nr:ATP-binding cassette domain-containing protein [Fusobacterium necrophorum]MBR8823002.1 Oligosaccharides import ATP-binding protein MsmX [Fusobacterium necrophorum]
MKILTIQQLGKQYQKKEWALHNIHLEIQEGEFLVLVGPSGCGKSTLLRLIAGLEESTEGEILFHSENKDIAMVFQNYTLYPHMTVYENMAFPLKMKSWTSREIQNKIAEIADTLEIRNLLQRKPNELSGGQKQRVALGRAMVREANIFLFDEALANLDANLRSQMRYELLSLQKKIKKTFIYVTHDQIEAMTMADRIVVMKEGQIEQIGSPKEIYLNPQTSFVARFLGNPAMNFLVQEEYILGIRPEDILITEEKKKKSFPFLVEFSEFLGTHSYLHGTVENTPFLIEIPIQAEYKKGETLFLDFPLTKRYYFDITTGRRIPLSRIQQSKESD